MTSSKKTVKNLIGSNTTDRLKKLAAKLDVKIENQDNTKPRIIEKLQKAGFPVAQLFDEIEGIPRIPPIPRASTHSKADKKEPLPGSRTKNTDPPFDTLDDKQKWIFRLFHLLGKTYYRKLDAAGSDRDDNEEVLNRIKGDDFESLKFVLTHFFMRGRSDSLSGTFLARTLEYLKENWKALLGMISEEDIRQYRDYVFKKIGKEKSPNRQKRIIYLDSLINPDYYKNDTVDQSDEGRKGSRIKNVAIKYGKEHHDASCDQAVAVLKKLGIVRALKVKDVTPYADRFMTLETLLMMRELQANEKPTPNQRKKT
jgi:hypothetical protein